MKCPASKAINSSLKLKVFFIYVLLEVDESYEKTII